MLRILTERQPLIAFAFPFQRLKRIVLKIIRPKDNCIFSIVLISATLIQNLEVVLGKPSIN